MELADIKKLADMARIEMSEEEMTSLAHDFEPILAYVGQIKEAVGEFSGSSIESSPSPVPWGGVGGGAQPPVKFSFTNVAREDVVTNTPGEYTDKIIAEFPYEQGGYLKVKQIL